MQFYRKKKDDFADEIGKMFPGKRVKNITFQLTEDCNLRCSYCYQINKSPAILDLETAKKFIHHLYDFSKDEPDSVAVCLEFIGGEPFLQTKLMDDIILYWMEYGHKRQHLWAVFFMVSISTNGTLTKQPEVKDFILKWRQHLSISVSLDGNKELHDACRLYPDGSGSYEDALATVYWLRENGYSVSTKMTFAPENIRYMFSALKNLIEIEYDTIFCNVIFEEGWTLEDAKIEYQQLRLFVDWLLENDKEDTYLSIFNEIHFIPMDSKETQNWCGGDGRMIAVNHTGNIYPCTRYMESSLGKEIAPILCGHVDTGIDLDLLVDMQKLTRQSQSTQECLECPVAAGCAWCTAYNYQKFGTINHRATFICWMHRAESLANVYFWNKLYHKHKIPLCFPRHLPDDLALQIVDEQELEMLNKLCMEV